MAWTNRHLGQIVMNTQEELKNAFDELEEGTFLKNRKRPENRPNCTPPSTNPEQRRKSASTK